MVEKSGFEADDIVGTLAEKFKGSPSTGSGTNNYSLSEARHSTVPGEVEELQIIIFSGDKDNLQLVDDDRGGVELLKSGGSKTGRDDKACFLQQYGFAPEQLVDYKALVGDVSDNIPGVTGIGPKGATDLIKEYGSVEKIYEEVGLIPKEVLRKKLEAGRENAFLSKKLAAIKRDVPLEITLDDLRQETLNKEELKKYFDELGFKSLTERL